MKGFWRAALAAGLTVMAFAAQAADKVRIGYIALPSQAPSFLAQQRG